MLGTELALALDEAKLSFVGTDRDVDITSMEALRGFATGKGIDWIINCAAYTAVEKAETDVGLCEKLNVTGPGNIGKVAAELGAAVIHSSTDYVYGGEGTRPIIETDQVKPLGVYGKTKADGEAALQAACKKVFILRTAWLYGKHGNNFVFTMLKLMKAHDTVKVVNDQFGSPTWAKDLSAAIVFILQKKLDAYGIYHFTNEGKTEWHEFAAEIYRLGRAKGLLTKDCAVAPISTEEFGAKVKRPAYSVLNKDKIRALGIKTPDWKEALKKFIDTEVEA
jgi:dTDP-4-dehydrorhamnose reductase